MNSHLGRWQWTDNINGRTDLVGKSLAEHSLAAKNTLLLKCQKYRVVVSCQSSSSQLRTNTDLELFYLLYC